LSADEKSRSRTALNSKAILLCVVHGGSGGLDSGAPVNLASSRAIAEATSLADSAISAGQRKAMAPNCWLADFIELSRRSDAELALSYVKSVSLLACLVQGTYFIRTYRPGAS
jgi:hypothetical protein